MVYTVFEEEVRITNYMIQPFGFKRKFEYAGHRIEYTDVNELGQGGPETGKLFIDGKQLLENYFSGPLIFYKDLICIPVLSRSFLSSGFKLGMINLDSRTLELVTKKEPLVLIEKANNGVISYFTDIRCSRRKEVLIT